MVITTYQFHYQNPKHSYWHIFLLIGGIIAFGISMVVWLDFLITIPWYIYLILFVLWILIIRINFKKIKEEQEEVTLTTEGFQSALFGTVTYEEIQSYRMTLLQAKVNTQFPVPTLHIKLKSGKKIKYDLCLKYYKQEFPVFFDFIVRFVELMKNRDVESYEKAQEKLDQYEVVVAHPKKYLGRVAGWSTTIAIFGLAAGQFIRSNPDLFKTNDVLELQQNVSLNFDQQKKLLQEAINREGEVYLWSNDTTVTVRLIPNMEEPKDYYPGGPMFRDIEDAQKIEDFLAQRDTLGFYTVIDFGKKYIEQRPAIPIKEEVDRKYLYFTLVNRKAADSTRVPKIINWGISYRDVAEIQDDLNHSYLPFESVIAPYLREYPDAKLYVTGSESKGTERKDFKKAMEQIKQLFQENQLDASGYRIK